MSFYDFIENFENRYLITNALENALDQWNRKKIAKSNYTLDLCYSGA